MPYSFDSAEYAPGEESEASEPGLTMDEVDDSVLDEDVGARIEVAKYLQVLMNEDLFFGDESAGARIVTRMVREFARMKARVLLGLEAAATADESFSAEEVTVLKAVASKILQRPTQVQEPVVRRPQSPLPAPSITVTRVSVAPKAEAKAKAPVKPVPVKGKTPVKAKGPPKAVPKDHVVEDRPMDGGGRVLTRKKSGRILREHYGADGALIETRDITPQTVPAGGHPMPSPHQMAMITESQAQAVTSQDAGVGSLLMQHVLKQ